MKRIIVDYKKLTIEILNLLVDKFPDGYGIRDIVKFTNHKGQYIEAVEVVTEDTMYLVRISNELIESMESHDEVETLNSEIVDDIGLEGENLDDDE